MVLEWCFFEAIGESTEAKWSYQPGVGSYRRINSYQLVGVGKGDFVKEDGLFGGEWTPVAKGSGSYIRIQTFQHVGRGQGDYDKEETTAYREMKLRPWCIWLWSILVILLLALMAILYYWPAGFRDIKSWVALGVPSASDASVTTFDCDVDFYNWKAAWSDNKKEYCCVRKGCHFSYDCDAGYHTWKESWSSQKQRWCCTNRGRGCESRESQLYDCQAGFEDWQRQWSDGQKLWCCTVFGKGCPSEFTDEVHEVQKPHEQFECNGPSHSWSSTQRSFCCTHHQKGCPEKKVKTQPQLKGCEAHCDLNGQKQSCQAQINSAARSAFAHQNNACGKAYEKVKSECAVCSSCALAEVTCKALPVSKPFDCGAALQNWVARWSEKKKDWCCKHEMKGCGDAFCENFEELRLWTTKKKAFCCRTTGNGCTGSQPPLVSAGHGFKWKRAKVDGMSTWIRDKVEMPKPKVEPPSKVKVTKVTSFDCKDGYHDFVHLWSTTKKHWCCEQEGLACTGPNHPAVPLKLNHQWKKVKINDVWTWTQVKANHVTETYDCTEGLPEASSNKLAYCCAHFGKGCE